MSMTIKYSNQTNSIPLRCFSFWYFMYYLTVYYLYIYVNLVLVDAASTYYSTLPRIYNYEQECYFEEKQCRGRAWHIDFNIKLKNPTHTKQYDKYELDGCLDLCQSDEVMIACGAVQYNLYTNLCSLYREGYETTPSNHMGNESAYILKCCILKKSQISKLYAHQLPIVSDPEKNCLRQNDTNTADQSGGCEAMAFHFMQINPTEKLSTYKKFFIKDTFECMMECLEDAIRCKSYKIDIQTYFPMSCHLLSKLPVQVSSVNRAESQLFRKICCKTNGLNIRSKSNKKKDLMMLYQPKAVCKVVGDSTNSEVDKCNIKDDMLFWLVEDNVQMTGAYKEFPLENLQKHLNDCIEEKLCVVVSVYWPKKKVYFSHGGYDPTVGIKLWTSYRLKCCYDFKKDLIVKTDVSLLNVLPIVRNVEKECSLTYKFNPKLCYDQAWKILDNHQIINEMKVKDNVTLEECFYYCLIDKHCVAVKVDNDSKKCFMSGTLETSEHEGSTAYLLTCCDVKKTKK